VGASIVHGRDIALRASRSHDGPESWELVPVDGDYHYPAYSSVAAVVEMCRGLGVPADVWPIYYGADDRDVPLDEVRQRCGALRSALGRRRAEDIARHWLLRRVWEWLASGEVFCVRE
jgi:hypothetical protein